MGNEDQNHKQSVTEIINFVSSLLVSIAGLFGAIKNVGGLQIFAIIMAALGVSWFAFLLYRYFKRKKHRRRMLHTGKEPGDTGFNEALSYTTNDSHRFYGRQNDTFNIMNQITREDYRLGVLHGESGVGKTSIIQAGLVPELEKKNIPWAYISFNSLPMDTETSEALLEFLVRQLNRAFELLECQSLEDITKKLVKKQAGFSVVFLDQFEQIFDRTDESTRQDFAQYLEQFCFSNDRLKIVVIAREDYFGRVHNMFQQLKRKAISYLYKFNLPQAREVIRKSAGYDENLNETQPDDPLLAFEDEILDDLKDMDQRVHPVELSLICSTMMKVNGKLDRHAYLEEGKKQGWLNRYLDDVLKGQPKKESLQLLSSLIHMDKAATLTAKEVSQRSGLNLEETRRLLKDFQQSRLIVADVIEGEKEEKTYHLAHEYLIASIRIRLGDVETPVQKYSRLLETRAKAWERDNRNPHHLLRGKSLLKIRFQLKMHLGWDKDPLKKTFLRKSFYRYLTVILSAFVIISALLIGIFFTVHSLNEEIRLTGYLSDLKHKGGSELPAIEKELLRLSKESIDCKIKVLKVVLSVDNENLYDDGIMPVLYHTLIGISMENRDKVMDYALGHIFPGNVGKLNWLFTRESMSPADRLLIQQKLIDILEKTKSSSYQDSIANWLGNIGNEEAVDSLKDLLRNPNASDYVKRRAAYALGKIGKKGEKAVGLLIDLLKDPNADNDVKSGAAYALGKIGIKSEKTIDTLIELLKDPDTYYYLRGRTVEALGNIGSESEKAVDALIELLKDPDRFDKIRAAYALGKIGIKSEKAVDALIELLKDPDKDVKISAAETLEKMGIKSEKAVDTLIDLLKDPDKGVKISAADVLGNIGSEKAVDPLIELLKDPNDKVRISAAEALGNIDIKSERVVDKLIDLLKNPYIYYHRGNTVDALGKLGIRSEKAVDTLIDLLKDWDKRVKISAVAGLGNIGSEKAMDTLIELLKNSDNNVKINAAFALGNIGTRSEKAVDPLIDLLKDPSHYVKRSVAIALGKIGNPAKDALPGLKQLYEKEKDIRIKFYSLLAMLRIDPANKEYLEKMIEEILPHPLAPLRYYSLERSSYLEKGFIPTIIRTIGEVASKNEEGKKVVGKNLDFDGNMWTMLEWWKTYKEKK